MACREVDFQFGNITDFQFEERGVREELRRSRERTGELCLAKARGKGGEVHKVPTWMCALHNPSWTQEGLRRRRSRKSDGELRIGRAKGKAELPLHPETTEPKWVEDFHNSSWIQEQSRRNREKDEEESRRNRENLCLGKSKGKVKVFKTHQEFQDCSALLNLIKSCAKIKDLCKGSRIHADILKRGLLQEDIYVGTALLHMYAKCGALAKAQEVFDELPARDVASWNALIAGYAQQGLGNEAWNCFGRMRDEGFFPDSLTFVCILKACGIIGAIELGEQIHVEVGRQGLLDKNIKLGTALVDMYAKCGSLTKAQEVFDELPARDVASWTALIGGYAQHGLGDEAINCYGQMQEEGLSPVAATFVCILKACGSIGATEKGEEIHAEVSRQGLLGKNIVLGTALVDMYAKCGALGKAQEAFDELPVRDLVSWNVLIAGYAQHDLSDEAVNCFKQMQYDGVSPDIITFISILEACGSIGAAEEGKEIHAEIRRQGPLGNNIVLGTALVDMYAKCGVLEKAQEVFDELPTRDIAAWTSLMAGYAQHGFADEALDCFRQMQDESLSLDAAAFVYILKACGSIGAIKQGEEIHAKVGEQGLLENHVVLGNALVDMYAKCGALAKAHEVFDKLPARDVVSWTVLIAGYAQHGEVKGAFDSFRKMVGDYKRPTVITFIILLTACSHAGLVEEGQMYFDTMSTTFHIIPTLEHHTCMLDLFIRAGHFDKAIGMIEKVPISDCLQLWSTLLSACQRWVNVDIGRWAFEHAIQLDENYDAAHVCMSNIYAAAGMQDEADKG